jgi:hypothetical protein
MRNIFMGDEGRPQEEFPVELREIENAQAAYRESVEAIIRIMKRRGIRHYPRRAKAFGACIDRLCFLDLAALLEDRVREEIKRLEDAGYEYSIEGDDERQFFDRMHALLKNEEPKSLLSGEELSSFLPLPNKALDRTWMAGWMPGMRAVMESEAHERNVSGAARLSGESHDE